MITSHKTIPGTFPRFIVMLGHFAKPYGRKLSSIDAPVAFPALQFLYLKVQELLLFLHQPPVGAILRANHRRSLSVAAENGKAGVTGWTMIG